MIPHRRLESGVAASALKDRVTACRKRLRENRTMTSAPLTSSIEELFPAAETARIQNRPFSARSSPTEGSSLLLLEEEVGIT